MRKKKLKIGQGILVGVAIIFLSFPFIFRRTIIEHTTRVKLPSSVHIVSYSSSVAHITSSWGLVYNPVTAVLKGGEEDYDELLKSIGNAISLGEIQNPIEFCQDLLIKGYNIELPAEITKIVAYSANMSGSPRVDIVLILDNQSQLTYYVCAPN